MLFIRRPAKRAPSYFIFVSCSRHFSILKLVKINVYTLCTVGILIGYFNTTLKCNVALIVPGGYCSCVTLCSWHVQSLGTSRHNNHISNSPPRQRKDGMPLCQAWLEVGKKRRVAHSGNLHKCSSCCKFVSGNLGTWVPRVSVNGQPVLFPAPFVGSCSKVSLGRSHSSCRDVSQQGPQTSPVRELVTGDPMACSVSGHPRKHPSGTIAHRQCWQLLPGLEHGCVESINQLARYHTQTNTPTE